MWNLFFQVWTERSYAESYNKDPRQGPLKGLSKFGANYDLSQHMQSAHKTGIL